VEAYISHLIMVDGSLTTLDDKLLTLGARAPGNGSEHLRNIEGRGTIYLAHFCQAHFMPILNVT